MAISDRTTIDFLYMPVVRDRDTRLTSSGRRQNQASADRLPTAAKQFVMAYTLRCISWRSFPQFFSTHIKIDVDGLEHLVIFGADKTLGESGSQVVVGRVRLPGLEGSRQAIDFIQSKGFKIVSENQRIEQGFFNYIFQRP